MFKVTAYYQPIFKFDLSKFSTSEEDGTTIITFKDHVELGTFLHENQLIIREMPNKMNVLITKTAEPDIYGALEDLR